MGKITRKIRKVVAILSCVAMVLSSVGLISMDSLAAMPSGFDEDWTGKTNIAVRIGSVDGPILTDGAAVSKDTVFFVTGSISLPTSVKDGGILGGENITDNYAGKKYYLGTVSENLSVNSLNIPIYDGAGSGIQIGMVSFDDGHVAFEFDDSTDELHIANTDYNDYLIKDITFQYKAKISDETISTKDPSVVIKFSEETTGSFTIIINEFVENPVTVEKKSMGFDEADNTVTWKVDILSNNHDVSNNVFTIKDTFDEKQTFIESSLAVSKGTISDLVVSAGEISFKYTADDDFKSGTRTIEYKTYVDITDKDKVDGFKSGITATQVENTVTLENSTEDKFIGTATAKQSIESSNKNWLAKVGDNVKVSNVNNEATMDWTITIDSNDFYQKMDAFWVTDYMDSVMEYVPGTAKVNFTSYVGGNVEVSKTGVAVDPDLSFEINKISGKNLSVLGGNNGCYDLKKLASNLGATSNTTRVHFEITYTTKVSDFQKYVEVYSVDNGDKVKNTATLGFLWKGYNGEGTGSEIVTGPTVTASSNLLQGGISKSGTANPAEGYVEWTITVKKTDLSRIHVVDALPSGLTYDPATANLTVLSPASEYTVTTNDVVTGDNGGQVDFKIIKNGDYDNNKVTDDVTFKFRTYVANDDIRADSKKYSFKNVATLKTGNSSLNRAEAKVYYRKELLSKTDELSYDDNSIEWTVNINKTGLEMGTNDNPIKVVDTIPCGTTLDLTSLRYKVIGEGEKKTYTYFTATSGVKGVDVFYEYIAPNGDTPGKLTVYLPNCELGKSLKLNYVTDINLEDSYWKTSFKDKSGVETITNNVTLYNNYNPSNNPTASATAKFKHTALGKKGVILDKETVKYEIQANSLGYKLVAGTEYKDELSTGMYYYKDGFVIYTGTISSDGSVVKTSTQLVEGVDYKVIYDTNAAYNQTMTIKLLKDIECPLLMEYYVKIPDTSVAESYTNTIWRGDLTIDEGEVVVISKVDIDSASGTSGLEKIYRNTLHKTDADNSAVAVSGAEYGLYSDSECTTLVDQGITDSNGNIVFWDLDKGDTYYVKELSAPEGYKLDEEVHEFTVNDTKTYLDVEDAKITGGGDEPPVTPPTPPVTPPTPPVTPPPGGEVLGEKFYNPKKTKNGEVLGATFVKTGDVSKAPLFITMVVSGVLFAGSMVTMKRKKDEK